MGKDGFLQPVKCDQLSDGERQIKCYYFSISLGGGESLIEQPKNFDEMFFRGLRKHPRTGVRDFFNGKY